MLIHVISAISAISSDSALFKDLEYFVTLA